MNKQSKESWRDVYLRLLKDTPDDQEQKHELSQDDLRFLKDLCDEGFIDGKIDTAGDGSLFGWTDGLTLSGRLFYEDQKNIRFNDSFIGRSFKGLSLFTGWVSGVISAFIIFKITTS